MSLAAVEQRAPVVSGSIRLRSRLHRALLFLLTVLALMSVALLNGYPIVHYDSGAYVVSSFTFEVPASRPVVYSLFIWLSRGLAPSLWSTVLCQSLLAAAVIHLFLRARGATGAWALTISVLLVLLSSVAWFSGLIMADLFTGLMFLAVVTLLLDGHPSGWARLLFLVVVIAFAVTAHASHLLILPLFLIAAAWLSRGTPPSSAPAWGAAWAAFAVALIALPAVNGMLGAGFHVSRGAHVFILGRWIDFGAVPRLLDDRCDREDYSLCPYRDQLRGATGNWFLWTPESPLPTIGGWERSETASWPMLRDAMRYRTAEIAWGTLVGFGKQLLVFRTGRNHVAYDDRQSVAKAIRKRYPDESERWHGSLQQRSQLRDVAWWVNWIHLPVAVAGIAFVLVIALPARLGGSRPVAPASRFLARAVLAFLVINAAVCAAVSATNDRYQSRVTWLVTLVVLEILVCERASSGPGGVRSRRVGER